jgi:hypothetical protein
MADDLRAAIATELRRLGEVERAYAADSRKSAAARVRIAEMYDCAAVGIELGADIDFPKLLDALRPSSFDIVDDAIASLAIAVAPDRTGS